MTKPNTSLKAFMLGVVLWLPLGFFLWFYLSSILVIPVEWLMRGLLTGLLSDHFAEVGREAYLLLPGPIVTLPEGRAVVSFSVNPMLYGYGLPLVGALMMSTPTSGRRRALQIAIAFVAICLVQTWGCFWDTFKTLAFSLEGGAALVKDVGIPRTLIALCYQFGYLILPSVVPVVLWIALNRGFIEEMIESQRETQSPERGQQ